MTALSLTNRVWKRFHDSEGNIAVNSATINCADDATGFIQFCLNRPAGSKLKAVGSHWGLSSAAISDGDFIETHWPGTESVPLNSGPSIDMLELVSDAAFQFLVTHPPSLPDDLSSDPCIIDGVRRGFFVHIKSGTRVYETYSLLDSSPQVITDLARKLNDKLANTAHKKAYDGPWAFQTLGGAGGQTVFGALTTGTHGGDYFQQPISDSVMALHLITDGGAHYWIEPETSQIGVQLTDDDKLTDHFRDLVPEASFEIIRDDDIFNAVVVSVGRFGMVSSVVLRVVPQYCLHEHRRIDQWSNVKKMLRAGKLHHAFDAVHFAGSASDIAADKQVFTDRFGSPQRISNRFLQIAVNLSPNGGGDHLCGVSQRWFYPTSGSESINPDDGSLRGRKERGISQVAGHASSYVPPDDATEAGGNTTFLSRACSNGNFVAGLLREFAAEIDDVVASGVVPAGGIAATALGIGAGSAVLAIAGLCAALVVIAALLKDLASDIESSGDISLAATTDKAIKAITSNPLIPHNLAIMVIRSVFDMVFRSQQSNRDYVAVSYAVMDGHDYLDRSCFGNAESIEVFLDAARADLYCAYVDAVLSFESYQQEQKSKFSAGYVSLRFVKGSSALIAPSRFGDTVVIEVAALRDAAGSVDFVMNAARLARNPMFNASFHWGQYNPATRAEVERQFGGRLDRWRNALATLTGGGSNNAFSNAFTRQTGLEL